MSGNLQRPRTTGSLAGNKRRDAGEFGRAPQAPITSSETKPIADRPAAIARVIHGKLSPAEFNTAMVHFYRGEVQRSNTWRNRLDTTTNCAVLTAGATLSFAFSAPTNPHFVIIINSVLVAFFLFMEARRYRYYEIWSSRVRVLETGYFAQMLVPESARDDEWAEHLANDLLTLHFTISEWEAVWRRFRRNYLWIFALLALSWNLNVYLHATPAVSFDQFVERSAVGLVPGSIVIIIGVLFNATIFIFAMATIRLREATGEVLPHHEFSFRSMKDWTRAATQKTRHRATSRRSARARARVRQTAGATGEWRKPIVELEKEEVGK